MAQPKTARPSGNARGRWAGVAVVLALAAPCPADSAKRERALEFYTQAVEERAELDSLPAVERTPDAYERVVRCFRRVYFTSPQSSKADDSLVAVAEIYTAMSRRFGPVPYREKAAEAYRFLVKEYPYSPFCAEAQKKLEALEAGAQPGVTSRSRLPQVTDVRHWSFPGFTRVIVDLESEVPVRTERLSNPDRIFFDLPNTRLPASLKNKSFVVGDELIRQIRVAQTQIGVTRVVIDLKSDTEHTVSTLPNPARIVMELRGRTAGKKPLAASPVAELPKPEPARVTAAAKPETPKSDGLSAAQLKPAQVNPRGEQNLIRALGLKISRVVIDPGHGGHDTGTIGPTGLMEKDLALDVAIRLGKLVTERIGSEVVLTRDSDVFRPLEERTRLANEMQADLFLSIHANSSPAPSSRGIETYYLNLTADREALEVAARENAASQKSVHDLQDLVSKITMTEKIAESREFALQVQRSLFGAMSKESASLRNRGVRKAPFVVLIGARMPSVLAEISFLSNPRDEKLLKTPAYRQRVAEALYSGLAGYCRSLSRVEVAAAK